MRRSGPPPVTFPHKGGLFNLSHTRVDTFSTENRKPVERCVSYNWTAVRMLRSSLTDTRRIDILMEDSTADKSLLEIGLLVLSKAYTFFALDYILRVVVANKLNS